MIKWKLQTVKAKDICYKQLHEGYEDLDFIFSYDEKDWYAIKILLKHDQRPFQE